MTTTEQNEIIAAFEAHAARHSLGCSFHKTEGGPHDPIYHDDRTEAFFALYRAGYQRARCCYGMVAPE